MTQSNALDETTVTWPVSYAAYQAGLPLHITMYKVTMRIREWKLDYTTRRLVAVAMITEAHNTLRHHDLRWLCIFSIK